MQTCPHLRSAQLCLNAEITFPDTPEYIMFSYQEDVYASVTTDNNIVVSSIQDREILWSVCIAFGKKIKQIYCYRPTLGNYLGIFVSVISDEGNLSIFQVKSMTNKRTHITARWYLRRDIEEIKNVKKCLMTYVLTENGNLYCAFEGKYRQVDMPDKIEQITRGNKETNTYYPNIPDKYENKYSVENQLEEILAIDTKGRVWTCDIIGRVTPAYGKPLDGAKMCSGCLVDIDGRIWVIKKGIYEEVINGQQVEFEDIVDVHYNGSEVGVLDNRGMLHIYKRHHHTRYVNEVTNLPSL